MAQLQFAVRQHSVWQGGPATPAAVPFVPALQRRRLTPLARALFHTIHQVRDAKTTTPMVLSSIYGDSQRTFALLQAVAENDELSPTEFSLSVHNAIAGQLSIALDETAPIVSLAPGHGGMTAALLEAAGLLAGADSFSEVLVAWYDGPLPQFYRPYVFSPDAATAIALRLATAHSGEATLRLERCGESGIDASGQSTAIAALLAGETDRVRIGARGHSWEWRLQ